MKKNVIAGLELNIVRLVSVKADRFHLGSGVYNYQMEVRVLQHQIKQEGEKRMLATACAVLLSNGENPEGVMVPAQMEAVFEAIYEISDPGLKTEDLTEFVKANVPFNLWPYFRELFQTISVRMQINPLVVLPLMKPGKPIEVDSAKPEIK